MITCYVCRDSGFEGEPCPECGKIREEILQTPERSKETDTLIPEHYQGLFWNETTLRKFYSDKADNEDFNMYVDVLTRMDEVFKNGGIPNYSAIVISPLKYSKTTFAYSCMQYALNTGFSVAPLLNVLEVSVLINNSHFEELQKDLMFMTIPNHYSNRGSWEVIIEVLEYRARINKPTFVISEFPLRTLCKWDKHNKFMSIIDKTKSGDPKKYPRVIELFDSTMQEGY